MSVPSTPGVRLPDRTGASRTPQNPVPPGRHGRSGLPRTTIRGAGARAQAFRVARRRYGPCRDGPELPNLPPRTERSDVPGTRATGKGLSDRPFGSAQGRPWAPDRVRGGNLDSFGTEKPPAFAVFAGFLPPPEAYRALHGRRYKSPKKKRIVRPVCFGPARREAFGRHAGEKRGFPPFRHRLRPDPAVPTGAGIPDIV